MRRTLLGAALVAALGVSAVASAQDRTGTDYTPTGMSLRGGVTIPLDSTLSRLGNTLFDIGIDYQVPTSFLRNSETYISFDYWASSLRFNKGSVIPIAINQRFYSGGQGALEGSRTYLFVGLGAAFIDIDNSEAAIMVRGGIGKELGPNTFFETIGTFSDRAGGGRANAVAFNIGYRF